MTLNLHETILIKLFSGCTLHQIDGIADSVQMFDGPVFIDQIKANVFTRILDAGFIEMAFNSKEFGVTTWKISEKGRNAIGGDYE